MCVAVSGRQEESLTLVLCSNLLGGHRLAKKGTLKRLETL